MEKDILDLNGDWEFKEFPDSARRMRDLDQGGWMKAVLPSSIFTCLSQAGILNEFDLNAHPEDFAWISEKSWIFRKTFDVDESFLAKDRIDVVFDGLDTVTQVWVNEKLVGKTENMFISHRFNITPFLKPGRNELYVKFLPIMKQAERLMMRYGKLSEHHFGDPRRTYVRKAQYQFGSVLGPALTGCGIFRPVRLEAANVACIDNLHLRTVDCDQHAADVRLALRLRRLNKDRTALSCNISFTGGGLNLTQTLDFQAQDDLLSTILHIERPILWWPKGYGIQHLYHVKAELVGRDGEVLDCIEKDFGIRTIGLIRNKDKHGHQFQFEINGQPIYIKGANWMPLSIHPTTPAKEEYESILKQLTDGHFNMLRVWAGGYYEDPAFYELCDKLGILVWQDFMFASAYYPDRQWFKDAVKIEARRIIERLRNHPSVALWCGNSRIDHLHETGRLGTGRKFYGKSIYHKLLPGLLSELDPTREYIPTTPFAEADDKDHNTPASGTTHSWDLWNNYASAAECVASEAYIPRFIAEFGLQSIPDIDTLSSFCKPRELRMASGQLERHCYQPGGFGRMARYMTEEYSPPKDLAASVWQSQVVQARSLKLYVEHLRAMNHINAGCLIWTLSDFAPAVSFSILDYQRSAKALYYYARRFFSPILVAFINDKQTRTLKAVVVNDSPSPITGTLNCAMKDFNGHLMDSIQIPVTVSPYAKTSPLSLPKMFSQPPVPGRTFLQATLENDDTCLAENIHLFGADKHLQLTAADIELEIDTTENQTWVVALHSKTLVRDLQLCPPEPAAASDNFITLLPNTPKTVTLRYHQQAPSIRTPMRLFSANQMQSRES